MKNIIEDHCEKRCVHVLDSFKYVIDHKLKENYIYGWYLCLLSDVCSFYFTIKKLHIPGLNILFDFFFEVLYNTNIFQNLNVIFLSKIQVTEPQQPCLKHNTRQPERYIYFFSISGIVLQSTFWQSHI